MSILNGTNQQAAGACVFSREGSGVCNLYYYTRIFIVLSAPNCYYRDWQTRNSCYSDGSCTTPLVPLPLAPWRQRSARPTSTTTLPRLPSPDTLDNCHCKADVAPHTSRSAAQTGTSVNLTGLSSHHLHLLGVQRQCMQQPDCHRNRVHHHGSRQRDPGRLRRRRHLGYYRHHRIHRQVVVQRRQVALHCLPQHNERERRRRPPVRQHLVHFQRLRKERLQQRRRDSVQDLYHPGHADSHVVQRNGNGGDAYHRQLHRSWYYKETAGSCSSAQT